MANSWYKQLLVMLVIGSGLICSMAAVSKTKTPPAPKDFVVKGDASKGKELFDANCALCHGSRGDGKGLGGRDLNPPPRNFTNAKDMQERSDWRLFRVITDGGEKNGLSSQMASYKNVLTEQNIKDIILHIRTFAKSEKPTAH